MSLPGAWGRLPSDMPPGVPLQTNEKGQVVTKTALLKQMEELIEEPGLTCCICREGYKFQVRLLGLWAQPGPLLWWPPSPAAFVSLGHSQGSYFRAGWSSLKAGRHTDLNTIFILILNTCHSLGSFCTLGPVPRGLM